MTTLDLQVFTKRVGSTALAFVAHTLAALALGTMTALFLTATLSIVLPHQLTNNVIASAVFCWCVEVAAGLSLGYVVNRVVVRRAAYWVWVPGLIWLAIGIRGSVENYDPRGYQGCTVAQNIVNAFFLADSNKCGGGESTLNSVLFTTGALASIGYSIGAWRAMLVGHDAIGPKRWGSSSSEK